MNRQGAKSAKAFDPRLNRSRACTVPVPHKLICFVGSARQTRGSAPLGSPIRSSAAPTQKAPKLDPILGVLGALAVQSLAVRRKYSSGRRLSAAQALHCPAATTAQQALRQHLGYGGLQGVERPRDHERLAGVVSAKGDLHGLRGFDLDEP